jgi:hypothetical protein
MDEKNSLSPIWAAIPFSVFLALTLLGCSPTITYTKNYRDVLVVFLHHEPPYCPDVDSGVDPAACDPWWTPKYLATIKPPRHTAKEYEGVLNQYVGDYYTNATFGQTVYRFHSLVNPNRADGWFTAPHNIEEYNQGADIYQDGIDVIDLAIGEELAKYQYVLIVQQAQRKSAQACCTSSPVVFYPLPRPYPTSFGTMSFLVAWVSEDTSDFLMAAGASHELGHLLGAPDQYNEYMNLPPAMGPWDIMADDPFFTHFSGWTKDYRGWLPQVTELPLSSEPVSITTVLDPIEAPGNNALRIPVVEHPYEGYYVECRKRINGDDNIPEEGVLVSWVDENRRQAISHTVHGDFKTAALSPGEVFVDAERQISVINQSRPGDRQCTVKATRAALSVPDPAIYQDWSPDEEAHEDFSHFETSDIWIDSPKNGWDVYPDYEFWDPEETPPHPWGLGDPFWVNHENRIGFRIYNHGSAMANHVIVEVYATQPITVSLPCEAAPGPIPSNTLVGSVVFDELIVGEWTYGYVPWKPVSDGPALVTVRIRDYPYELSRSNNSASEAYLHHEYTGTPTADISSVAEAGDLHVQVPGGCPSGTSYMAFAIGGSADASKVWTVETDPNAGVVHPDEDKDVVIKVRPPAGAQAGDCHTSVLGVFAPLGDVFTTIGGLAFQTCVVKPSRLSCITPDQPVALGSPVSVTGDLIPGLVGTPLALEYIGPSGWPLLRNVLTGTGGSFLDDFLSTLVGTWTVKAFWQGTSEYAQTESAACSFTVVPSPTVSTFTPAQLTNCRAGPGTAYEVVAHADPGVALPVEGRNVENSWLYVHLPGGMRCWVDKSMGSVQGDVDGVVILPAPPLPETEPELFNCGQYLTLETCNAHGQCSWDASGGGQCKNK